MPKRFAVLSGLAGLLAVVACSSFGDGDAAEPGPSVPDASVDDASGADETSTADGPATLPTPNVVGVASAAIPWVTLDATRVIWMTGQPEGDADGVGSPGTELEFAL